MNLLLLALLLPAIACSNPSSLDRSVPVPPAPGSAALSANALLPEARTSQLFSNAQRPDQFRLRLLGTSVLTATAHFSIVTAAGDTLWSERFPATRLLGGYGHEPATDATREAYISQRVQSFFEAKNFPAAAISPHATFDPDYNGSQAVWQDVKQRKAPGFRYVLGEENTRVLGYSQKLAKAVAVHRCC